MRFLFFSWIRRPPRSTRTDTLVPCTTLFRSPRLTVQTRSPIASRDIDLFQQFEHIRVNFTVTTDSEAVRLRYEPSAPAIKARLRAARALIDAGVPIGVAISPLRSDERRVGKECVRTGNSRWSAYR